MLAGIYGKKQVLTFDGEMDVRSLFNLGEAESYGSEGAKTEFDYVLTVDEVNALLEDPRKLPTDLIPRLLVARYDDTGQCCWKMPLDQYLEVEHDEETEG